jgi:effector-binding domain-containing protein
MTDIDIRIIDLEPHHGAGVETPCRWADLQPTIRKLFDKVYAPGALTPGHGHNFIMYRDETKEGCSLTVGVLDRQPGGADPDVKPAHIPGGRVIAGTHWGDYGKMRTTYDAINADLAARGLKRIWNALEMYGDWFDDPAKVRTDIHLYLAIQI